MPGLTDYSSANVLAYLTGKTAMPSLPTVYVGLFTTAPTSDSGVTGAVEVSGGAYARVATSGSTWATPTASNGSEPATVAGYTTNAATITFPTSTASWGTVVAFGLFDASTGGNLLAWDYIGNFPWLPASVSAATPGVYSTGVHGYSNGDPVVVSAKVGGTVPTGGTWSGVLTVAGVTTNTFNTGQTVTVAGDILVRKIVQQSIPSGITASFAASALTISAA
jgi:hypothetical protein